MATSNPTTVTATTAPADPRFCARCGLAATALIHRASANGHASDPPTGASLAPSGTAESAAEAPLKDPNGWEEDEEYQLRQRLGLRPISYAEDSRGGTHPDTRPCPPWCETAQLSAVHGIDPARPFMADHRSVTIAIAAPGYGGLRTRDGYAIPATIETTMKQLGQGAQAIELNLHEYTGPPDDDGKVRHLASLSIDTASDLVTALSYLIAQARAVEALEGVEQ